MTQIFYILMFYFLGELISFLTGKIIPGSVIGMVLLFVALQCKFIYEEQIKETANFLTSKMILFFIPVGVGVMIFPLELLRQNWVFLVIAPIISTLLVAACVAFIFEKWGK